jgi:hypothetical protein
MFGSRKEKRDEMVVGGIVGLGVAGPFCTEFFTPAYPDKCESAEYRRKRTP